MSLELLGLTILWTFLFGYLIVGAVDFGAGFFSLYSHWTGTKHLVHHVIERYLSPVWEVTNVFLIFFMVGFVGFFPNAVYYYGTALLVPGSIATILLGIRGSYYAFHTYGGNENQFYLTLYGISGLLLPASLATMLTLSEGGFLVEEQGTIRLDLVELFFSPYAWSVVNLALVSILYISAVFLAYYASRAGDIPALEVVRKWALLWSAPTIVASLFIFVTMRGHNREHFDALLAHGWWFTISFLCFLAAVWLVWQGRYYGWAFVFVMLQFGFAFFGYGASHLPYLLYPNIKYTDHFTSPVMGQTLIVAFVLGLFVLIPSLFLLLKLFLFDANYVKGMRSKGVDH
jgi:cytochrome d ubiquinol oxidase subunit II